LKESKIDQDVGFPGLHQVSRARNLAASGPMNRYLHFITLAWPSIFHHRVDGKNNEGSEGDGTGKSDSCQGENPTGTTIGRSLLTSIGG
jgi:hypothetical protein